MNLCRFGHLTTDVANLKNLAYVSGAHASIIRAFFEEKVPISPLLLAHDLPHVLKVCCLAFIAEAVRRNRFPSLDVPGGIKGLYLRPLAF